MQKLTCLVCGFAVSRSAALKHARTHCAADADADAAPVCAAVHKAVLGQEDARKPRGQVRRLHGADRGQH